MINAGATMGRLWKLDDMSCYNSKQKGAKKKQKGKQATDRE